MRLNRHLTKFGIIILFGFLACSCAKPELKPVAGPFYVTQQVTYLLDRPESGAKVVGPMYRGDKVERLDLGESNWWRVMVVQSRSQGWMPSAALAESWEEALRPQSPKAYYYVAVTKLSLRALPSAEAQIVRPLRFNDQVQKLAESQGWFKVRQPATGAVGWVRARDLATGLLKSPRRAPLPKEEPLRPPKLREEPPWEPEFM